MIKEGNTGTREGRFQVRHDLRDEGFLIGFPKDLKSVILEIAHDGVPLIVHHHTRWVV